MPLNRPVTSEQLDHLLRPERIALVGASDKNLFSRRAFTQHARLDAGKPITLVNPRTAVVHGTPTVPSCRDIEGGIDCAFLLTPQKATADALRDAAAGGAKAAAVLSQGWAEEGPDGRRQQDQLVGLAEELGVVLLGPNHLGFANFADGIALCALGLDMPIEPGPFALVTQSGAVGSSLVGYAARNDARFSFVVTTGNESMITVADVVRHLVEDEHTRSIGIFAETIRKSDVFRAAARRAAELGKAIIILKAGTSELAAATAKAHTGALVGDDRVIDALLRQEGVIRVRSVEDLICTGMLCANTGPLPRSGVGIMSVSGGACDLIADQGHDVGLQLPPLSDSTRTRLTAILPSFAHPQNPLDITGAAATRPDMWRGAFEALAAQPEIGLIGAVTSLPTDGEPQRVDTFTAVGAAIRATGIPGVIFPQIDQPQSEQVRDIKAQSGIATVLPGVERFVRAAAGLAHWSTWLRSRSPGTSEPQRSGVAPDASIRLPDSPSLSEKVARDLLGVAGVPFVPSTLATSRDEAITAAEAFDGAVVLKMCSAEVAHKTELGGVELDLVGDAAVGDSYKRITERADAAGVTLDGVLVSPMRRSGIELLVGVTRDADWGQVLAIAMGGALVELLDDTALRVLPVGRGDIIAMLGELRGCRLLHGFRGSKPVDMDLLVDTIVSITSVAEALAGDIESVEVNPLLVDGDRIEALDALITRV
ncbi:putative acyl-CoA synthetase [Gordonia polyisoprenivorans NBRC 16320 = JCM 10675]|uniref:Acetate--CoA ligase family protein n=1 Tax=Gordonia polyisoprenivorans TaxID=84595 RepID=A0A846WUX5_9ACTN|nr:acetate--CoA ligase family protein [Gordonia polyisoprenivorans]OZC29496.1 CoA-binding protein [Gordonia polyisoprenivorans]GAB25488.1 putative acyl-CoA synthetase [Gordonia polyisoprenivorans NBRC 16320 = JCM 10675]